MAVLQPGKIQISIFRHTIQTGRLILFILPGGFNFFDRLVREYTGGHETDKEVQRVETKKNKRYY